MKTHLLRGSKQEIAAHLAQNCGEVNEVIVFEEDPVPAAPGTRSPDPVDFFAEMRPHMVDVPDVDDSREAFYSRMEGE